MAKTIRKPITRAERPGFKNVSNVFLTRPLNALDSIRSGGTLSVNGTELIETGSFEFTIPLGYTGIIRNVNFYFDPLYPPNTLSSVITKIFIDGEPLKHNDAIENLQKMSFSHHFDVSEKRMVKIESIRTSSITLTERNLASPFAYEPTYTGTFILTTNPTFNLASSFERSI